MNDATTPVPADPPAPLPPPRARRTWLRILLLLAVFGGGFLCGAGVTVLTAVHRIRHDIQNPQEQPGRWAKRISRRMDLTDQEQAAVREALQKAWRRANLIRQEVYPRLQSELDQLEEDVAAVLPPEKASRWRNYLDDIRRNWIPPPPPPADAPRGEAVVPPQEGAATGVDHRAPGPDRHADHGKGR